MEVVNTEQAAAWDGHEGDQWTKHADRYNRSGQRHLARFLAAGVVGASDDVLDIGCGTGRPTRDAARIAASGSALGVDLSAQMLQLARERSAAEGLTNVTFVRGDAQVHPFDADAFDVAISSFGAMFFGDPVAAFTNIGRALRPKGRLALLAWRDLPSNEWLVELRAAVALGRDLPVPPPHVPSPFSLAEPDRVTALLGDAGYDNVAFTPIDEPMDMGDDVDDAFAFVETMGFVEGMTDGLDDAQRAEAMGNIRAMLERYVTSDGVLMPSAAWIITADR